MLRSAHSSGAIGLWALLPAMALAQQAGIVQQGDHFVREICGTAIAGKRLRVNAHGPVAVQAGVGKRLTYTVRVSVRTRSESDARRVLDQYAVRVTQQGEWTILGTPSGPAMATITIKAPRMDGVAISTSDGAVGATGVDGLLEVNTGTGEVTADRIGGDCQLVTGAGDIRVGTVGGALRCWSGVGKIQLGSVGGMAELETAGGDILVNEIAGMLRAQTGGGGIHVSHAGGAVTAATAGGEIVVDRAGGIVTVRNLAGPVRVGSALGVKCETVSGGVSLSNVAGGMQVATALGSIVASLLGGGLTDSYLATGNGDITVWIPANVGVNLRAQNEMADTMRRIAVDFPGVQVRRQGRAIVAEGAVNGGGPRLDISATVGTIFIRKGQ